MARFLYQRYAHSSCLLGMVACLTLLATLPLQSFGQTTTPTILRVEEDWVLQIREPSTSETSPQVTNTMSPTGSLNGRYCVFEVNHGTQPDYTDGGLELQVWDYGNRLTYRRHDNSARLRYNNETVRYTLSMEIRRFNDNGEPDTERLRLAVKKGTSQTWGTFGDSLVLRSAVDSAVEDLSNYSPLHSVANSGVGYASFRVQKFALVAVRYYDAYGTLVTTDTTERIAYQYSGDTVVGDPDATSQ